MAYAWTWLGLANVLASLLLLALGLLFFKARRTEFTVAFAIYCVLAAGQKLTGGVAFYFADAGATRDGWLRVSTLFLLGSTPTLAHALAAFTWGKGRWKAPRWSKPLLYVPFAVALPLALLGVVTFATFSFALLFAFMAILAVFLLAVLRKARHAASDLERSQARYVLAYLVIALGFSAEARVILAVVGRMPWWELSIAYMAATGILLYGILRAHAFDIELKLKAGLARGAVATAIVAAVLVTGQLIQNATNTTFGVVGGAVVAGLMLLAIRPLERAANRFADAAMPKVRDTPDYVAFRKMEVYKAALEELALGGVSPKERRALDALRDKLGIARGDAKAMERDVATVGVAGQD